MTAVLIGVQLVAVPTGLVFGDPGHRLAAMALLVMLVAVQLTRRRQSLAVPAPRPSGVGEESPGRVRASTGHWSRRPSRQS